MASEQKTVGEAIEDVLVDAIDGVEPVEAIVDDVSADDDHWYDVVVDAIGTGGELDVVFCGVDPAGLDGDVGEVKAAKFRLDDRFGRFNIRRGQHEKLVDAGGIYLLAVYRETDDLDDPDLAGLVIASADVVDETRNPWYELAGRDDYTQVRWTALPFSGELSEHSAIL